MHEERGKGGKISLEISIKLKNSIQFLSCWPQVLEVEAIDGLSSPIKLLRNGAVSSLGSSLGNISFRCPVLPLNILDTESQVGSIGNFRPVSVGVPAE